MAKSKKSKSTKKSEDPNRPHFAWMEQVAARADLSPEHKVVLLRLALYRNPGSGQCNPAYSRLAEDAGVCERTAKYAIAKAGQLGLIAVARARASGDHKDFNHYKFIYRGALTCTADDSTGVHQHAPRATNRGARQDQSGVHGKTIRGASACTLITSEYQGGIHAARAAPQEGVVEDALTTAPAGKSDPSDEELDAAFKIFWGVYPKQVGEDETKDEFKKAVREGIAADVLIAAARAYAADPVRIERSRESDRYTMDPANWLRKGRYKDYLTSGKPIIDHATGNLIATPRPHSHSGGSWAEDAALLLAHCKAGRFGKWGMQ